MSCELRIEEREGLVEEGGFRHEGGSGEEWLAVDVFEFERSVGAEVEGHGREIRTHGVSEGEHPINELVTNDHSPRMGGINHLGHEVTHEGARVGICL